MLYNWTVSGGVVGFFQLANNLTASWALAFITLAIFVAIFLSLLMGYGLSTAFITSGIIMFFMSALLMGAGLINPFVVFFYLVMAVIGMILMYFGH